MSKLFQQICVFSLIISVFTPIESIAQTKKLGLMTTTISNPKFADVPLLDAIEIKKRVKEIADTLILEENRLIDSLRLQTVLALEKITGYEVLYATALQDLPDFEEIETHPVPAGKTYGQVIVGSGDKNIFPIEDMKINGFFKNKSNYQNISKDICEKLGLDAIVYCNWRTHIFAYSNVTFSYGTFSSWIVCNFYMIGKDGNIIFEGFCFTNSIEVPNNEPKKVLKTFKTNKSSLNALVERWTKPKNQKKLAKKGM